MLVPTVITEPAVGYGAAAAAIYFHSSYTEKLGPPSMTGVLGGGTQNGTWMAGLFHIGYWNHDKIRYMGAVARTYINIGFYGAGLVPSLEDKSVELNMDAWLLVQQLKARVGSSNLFLGGRYIYYNTNNTFALPITIPEFSGTTLTSSLSEVSAIVNYDTRNNIFTPTKGFFCDLAASYSDTWMGGEDLYGRIATKLIGYLPYNNRLVLAVRQENTFSVGDIPFYARPVVMMRGVPIMKYQNTHVSVMEAEVDWNVYKRWYLVGFTGMGNAYKDFDSYDKGKSVSAIGGGFRYLLIRKMKAQMGMDFAKSNDDYGIYFIFGTAWMR